MTQKDYDKFLAEVDYTVKDIQDCCEFVLKGHELFDEITVEVSEVPEYHLVAIEIIDNLDKDCHAAMMLSLNLCKFMTGVAGYQLHEYLDLGVLYPLITQLQGERYVRGYIPFSPPAVDTKTGYVVEEMDADDIPDNVVILDEEKFVEGCVK